VAAFCYEVVADGYPEICRVCPGCGGMQAFACTGNFRVNANGKLIDVWLLYRCKRCGFTYNFTVLERVPVHKIDRAVLEGAMANDKALAGRYARDLGLMRRNRVKLERGDDWRLVPREVDSDDTAPEPRRYRCWLTPPLILRADHLAAAVLGTSRSAVAAWIRQGVIEFASEGNPRELRLWSQIEFRFTEGGGATTRRES
jgi:hypothetical protein